jgi:hypothetical protein
VFQASPLSLDRAFWFLEPLLCLFFVFLLALSLLGKAVSVSHHGFFFAYNGVCMRARVCMALVAAGRKKGGKQPCEKTIVSKTSIYTACSQGAVPAFANQACV